LRAERSHRELRLTSGAALSTETAATPTPEYTGTIPGEIDAPAFGLRLRIEASSLAVPPSSSHRERQGGREGQETDVDRRVTLRTWKAGDRVTLRHSSGPRKVKEVLERLRVTGSGRALWPVLELEGRIVWMRGVELEPEPGITFETRPVD
jgi:tRNA(Ile)-lysidine synthase